MTSTHSNSKSDRPQATVDTDSGRITLHIPMQFKRKSGRKEVILPGGAENGDTYSPEQAPLAIAVARAHQWLKLLEDGEFQSITELAEAVDMDPSLVRRHLHLTSLSPSLILAIINGREPDGLSLEKLKDMPVQ